MPPRRRPPPGYHGVRARPSGRFNAEIRSGEERIRLGTFDTAHEAARAYDVVAWRLGRSRRTMNFHDESEHHRHADLRPRTHHQIYEKVSGRWSFYSSSAKCLPPYSSAVSSSG
nr:ethylene-responsive transcription factor ERF073-like [Lolium perenne]